MSELPQISDFLLARLRDCAASSRVGMIDRGFPDYLRQLAALGLVEKVGDGHKITPQGTAFLRAPETRQQLDKL